jgi:hypothetical protein
MAVRHHGVIPYDLPVDHRRIVDLLVRPVWAVLEDRESRGYAAETGPIIGMEVVMAFAVEAGFIGVVLYGDGRVTRGTTQTEGLLIDEPTTGLDARTAPTYSWLSAVEYHWRYSCWQCTNCQRSQTS